MQMQAPISPFRHAKPALAWHNSHLVEHPNNHLQQQDCRHARANVHTAHRPPLSHLHNVDLHSASHHLKPTAAGAQQPWALHDHARITAPSFITDALVHVQSATQHTIHNLYKQPAKLS